MTTNNNSLNGLYIGLMSGTSLDGIDCVVCDIQNNQIELKHSYFKKWPESIRAELQALINGDDSLDLMLKTDQQCAAIYADCCLQILRTNQINKNEIIAIGSHGQTIRHNPNNLPGYSTQIGNPNRISESTGITTVADFRNRDIAAGGQGAPLAPAFHRAMFNHDEQNRIILNIGGIANITLLSADKILGYDTGPGNRLLDDWIKHSQNKERDDNGQFAASGKVHPGMLSTLLKDPYFDAAPPKSTGSDYFNLNWASTKYPALSSLKPEDVQATFSELTARSICNAIMNLDLTVREILVCGGGVHNANLMQRLQNHCQNVSVLSTAERGVDPDWIEAMAFAWLAHRTINNLSGNIPEVTGAIGERICGGIYPG